jgi:transposase
MIRSGTVNTIHELVIQGKSIRQIAQELDLARNTVRKYLRGSPTAVARAKRGSKLDPYKEQIVKWVQEDHLYNCTTMLPRLKALGYSGGMSILKEFVLPLRPQVVGKQPVKRYETKPGEQMQFDWAELSYEHDGVQRKVYGFVAILGYSRMRYITCVKRCDTPTMIRCLMAAFEYFGGLPQAVLTDRMKSVILEMDGKTPKWNPLFADFVAAMGIAPRVCKSYTPQTKGKVERSVRVLKEDFWPGVRFTDMDDLNEQAQRWCDQINQRIHQTTRCIPIDLWAQEDLRALPSGFAWERFGTEERKVTWDGYASYDGVLYGLPAQAALAGKQVLVRERHRQLTFWAAGKQVLSLSKRPRSQEIVTHPEQFRDVLTASASKRVAHPLAHQVSAPSVASRPLGEYDRLCGVGGGA